MMKQKYLFIIAAFFFLSIAAGVDAKVSRVILARDTVKPKHFTVNANTTLVLKNNAKLTVRGNLTVRGAIECQNGALNLEVKGNLRVFGTLKCIRSTLTKKEPLGNGIVIVAKKTVSFEDTALVITNGHVQLVDDAKKIARSQTAIDALYARASEDAGAPFQIGPLAAEGAPVLRAGLIGLTPGTPSTPQTPICTLTPPTLNPKPGIPGGIGIGPRVPPKQVPQPPQNPAPSPQLPKLPKGKECFDAKGKPVPNCVQIGGTWVLGGGGAASGKIVVPAPPKNIKRIILNYGFGSGKEVIFKDIEIVGPPAPNGEEKKPSCTVTGGDGYPALRFGAKAPSITVHNLIMRLGKGGDGANAATPECARAKATGGDGGTSGNLKLEAEKTLRITGSLCIFPGAGGKGGDAQAFGANGDRKCHGTRGGSAEATGGKGADNKKELRVYGSVQGTSNIYIGPLIGGNGGEAYAKAGNGGDGELSVGDPGAASATGGVGGVAHLATWGVKRVPGGEDKDGVQGVGQATQGSKGSATIIPCKEDAPADGGAQQPSDDVLPPPYRFYKDATLVYGEPYYLIVEGTTITSRLPITFSVLVDGRLQDLPKPTVDSADECGTGACSAWIPKVQESWRGKHIEFRATGKGGEVLAMWVVREAGAQ
ncbi:hypothetical protein HY624_02910 [Candidatus Uhrbacteria bacterium]|nr:hypothetical protein [Candidatus Uhrbacteria bacterium]